MNLRALTLSAFAALSSGCQIIDHYAPPSSQLEQNIDSIVAEGIDLFKEGKIPEAQALLEAYKDTKPSSFTAPAHTLLALCYVDSINLTNLKTLAQDLQKEFLSLNDEFLRKPEILFDVQDQFAELFTTPGYQRLEMKIQGGIRFEPALYGALFLLQLAQRKYEAARDSAMRFVQLKKFRTIPNHEDVVSQYKQLLSELSGYGSKRNDYNIMIGCARVAEAFIQH